MGIKAPNNNDARNRNGGRYGAVPEPERELTHPHLDSADHALSMEALHCY
ncbi:hypothetical protein P3T23_009252 [Paraburkholderia sp. GAS448]